MSLFFDISKRKLKSFWHFTGISLISAMFCYTNVFNKRKVIGKWKYLKKNWSQEKQQINYYTPTPNNNAKKWSYQSNDKRPWRQAWGNEGNREHFLKWENDANSRDTTGNWKMLSFIRFVVSYSLFLYSSLRKRSLSQFNTYTTQMCRHWHDDDEGKN